MEHNGDERLYHNNILYRPSIHSDVQRGGGGGGGDFQLSTVATRCTFAVHSEKTLLDSLLQAVTPLEFL
jgi:hypothetical protein